MSLKFEIFSSNDQDKHFYSLMGEYFANRRLKKEVGEQLYNEDNSVWFIALERNKVVGFAAAFVRKGYIHFDFTYTKPENRNKSIGSKLFKMRLDHFKNAELRVVVETENAERLKKYQKYGFEVFTARGRFSWLKRPSTDV
jgi:ribosomal protein S18 acetylase RimI-like enzyme